MSWYAISRISKWLRSLVLSPINSLRYISSRRNKSPEQFP